ncbi:MAG TPA: alpha-glucan family phosphorylase [Candidatus Polarisedimenticolaceae bacterium]|nr:alpha-glucan family phosphorylase [Candidatus Polarisedimenticolaceae bacterium]
MQPREIKTKPTASIEIPVQFSRLMDIAYNLFWAWSQPTRALFDMIDNARWRHYRNPIELLIDLEPQRWHELQRDRDFIRTYRAIVEEFDLYMAPDEPTWFDSRFPGYDGGPVAYFSTEYGWHECLQMYSGGLGVLSGDHSKAASDLDLPFIGIGLMYQHGYFRQTIDADGQQQHFYPDYDFHRVPLLPVVDEQNGELRVTIELAGRDVQLRAWKASVGRVQVLLLDTDLAANHPADRPITSVLYVQGREMRLCQEWVLGVGGVEFVRALGIRPAVWHMNEGHSALLSFQRLRRLTEVDGLSWDEARLRVNENAVFTTHTPVPAGNETFDRELVRQYVESWAAPGRVPVDSLLALGRARDDGGDESFNMTALAIRTSRRANGVSELHGKVAGGMWNHLKSETFNVDGLGFVTNGAHVPTWIGRDVNAVLRKHVDPRFEQHLMDIDFAGGVQAIPDRELWDAHCAQKRRLVRTLRARVLSQQARHGRSPAELRALDHLLDTEVLLVGFARRFATYKRADLLLRDFSQLREIVARDERPVQFVFAGKAHPADRPGQDLIRSIWEASNNPELKGRVLFIENYDMRVARSLVQGVDVWLNNPRRPLEASGTSGMKAAFNGGLNCSVLDGWWCEGYDASHGWVIGEPAGDDEGHQDHVDAESLYRVMREQVVPCFYDRDATGLPLAWVARMKRAIGLLTPRFSASRMVRQYGEQYYFPAK